MTPTWTPMRLSSQAEQATRTAALLVQRDAALCELCALIDPSGKLSTNGRAEALANALRRFECAPWQRISNGHRASRSAYEDALCRVLEAPGPKSARKLFDVLAELGF